MIQNKIINFCDRIIEGCFYTLLIVVTFSTSLVEIAASLMIAAWLTKMLIKRDLRSFDSVPARILLIFLLWTVLSCVNSAYFRESFRGVFKWTEYALIFLTVATEMRKESIVKRSLFVMALGAGLACLNGFYQYFSGTGFIRHRQLIYQDYLRRISSAFVHPNDYGIYLVIVIIIFISLLLSRYDRLRIKLAMLTLALISAVNLFLTKSRGAWISFGGAFLALGALKAKRVVAVFLVLLIIVFIMLPYTVQERIFQLTDADYGGTTWERLMLWKGTVNMIKVHPVLGFGVNTYSRNFPAYKPPGYWDVRYTHNCYLHMAAEVGIVGALLFLIFLVTVLVFSLKGIFLMPGGIRKDLSRGLFAGLVGFSMSSMVDTHLYSVNLAVFFHLLLGFCFALSYHARKN
ncbi:MAG: O-antigen ligase family protein [Candidatus Omnitrophota bacterium]|nr:O-antigen ligase family protein [Candidatus Omnitrophota bacterium]